jgi:hypothetical protein
MPAPILIADKARLWLELERIGMLAPKIGDYHCPKPTPARIGSQIFRVGQSERLAQPERILDLATYSEPKNASKLAESVEFNDT